jgi:hypothetical protein
MTEVIVFNTFALVAQRVELPPLKREAAGSIPAGCTAMDKEDVMERLISLFREPDYEKWSPSKGQPPSREHEEPLYFQQLLEYLRQEKAEKPENAELRVGAHA